MTRLSCPRFSPSSPVYNESFIKVIPLREFNSTCMNTRSGTNFRSYYSYNEHREIVEKWRFLRSNKLFPYPLFPLISCGGKKGDFSDGRNYSFALFILVRVNSVIVNVLMQDPRCWIVRKVCKKSGETLSSKIRNDGENDWNKKYRSKLINVVFRYAIINIAIKRINSITYIRTEF